jgi:hypothetical protein
VDDRKSIPVEVIARSPLMFNTPTAGNTGLKAALEWKTDVEPIARNPESSIAAQIVRTGLIMCMFFFSSHIRHNAAFLTVCGIRAGYLEAFRQSGKPKG